MSRRNFYNMARPAESGRVLTRARPFLGLATGVQRLLGLVTDDTQVPTRRERPHRSVARERLPEPPLLATVAAGRLSLVGLGEIREELGPRWEALSEKVHLIAQSVVAKHLVRGDVFERYGEDGYILLFAHLNKAEAEFKCHAIRNEIGRQLLGSEWSGLSKISMDCAEISKDALESGKLEEILAGAFDGEAAPTSGYVTAAAPARPTDTAPVGIGTAEAGDLREASGLDASQGNNAACAEPLAPPQRSAAFAIVETGAEMGLGAKATEQATWAYTPVWDFERMVLLRFRLTAKTVAGRRVHPFHADDGEAPQALLFDDDMRALGQASRDLTSLLANGRRLPIICPIHHSSLTRDSWASHLTQQVARMPAAVRRLLTIEICGSAANLGTLAVWSFVDVVDRLGIACSGCLGSETAPAPRTDVSLKAIHIELSQHQSDAAILTRVISSAAQHHGRNGVELGVYGLNSRSLVVRAATSGFRFLSGEVIHAEVASLGSATKFDLKDLYREFQPR